MGFCRPFKRPFRQAFRYATRMQYGLRRPAKINDLRLACRYVAQLIRWHKQMIKEDPELFDPRVIRERQEAEAYERRQREYEAMFKRIYSEP
jgi:hypothetical protein